MKRLLLLYLLLIVKKTTVGAHSLRRAESQTSLMEYPCLLLPNEDEGSEWECILDEREITFDDDRDCGQNINIEGLELTDEQEEKVRSHSTLLLPNDEHFFVGGEKLVIDGTPEFEFYPKLGGSLGEKKAIMIRVVAKDQEPSHSLEELAKETFGDGQISQYEKCSHGKMKITPFEGTINGKTIENGVYEYKLPFDWPWPYKGIDEEDPVHEVVSCNLAKELGSFWYLRHGIDFVMYCIPEPLNGRYAYANNDLMLLTVYGDGTCLETKTHLHEIGHNLYLGHPETFEIDEDDGDHVRSRVGIMGDWYSDQQCFNGAFSSRLLWYQDRQDTFGLDQTVWSGKLVGVVDYKNTKGDEKVILKLDTIHDFDFFLAFNRKAGFNSGTGQGEDKVLLTKMEQPESETALVGSMLLAELSEGESFTVETKDDNIVSIQVDRIDLSSNPAYALVTVTEHEYFMLESHGCIEPKKGSVKKGNGLVLGECTNPMNSWRIEEVKGKDAVIFHSRRDDDKCIQATHSGVVVDGSKLRLYPCNRGNVLQHFVWNEGDPETSTKNVPLKPITNQNLCVVNRGIYDNFNVDPIILKPCDSPSHVGAGWLSGLLPD